jgi:hypothetical protein
MMSYRLIRLLCVYIAFAPAKLNTKEFASLNQILKPMLCINRGSSKVGDSGPGLFPRIHNRKVVITIFLLWKVITQVTPLPLEA